MKAIFSISIMYLALIQCNSGNTNYINSTINNDSLIDNQHKFEEFYDTLSTDFYLSVTKLQNGIELNYKLKKEKVYRTFSFDCTDYSQVLFPEKGIGLIQNNTYKTLKFCIIRDSILFLPIIGIHNLISVYIINLKTQNILGNELRTSLNLIWIKEYDLSFITSDTPDLSDSVFKINIKKFSLRNDSLDIISIRSIKLNYDPRINQEKEYLLSKTILSN